MRRRIPVAVLQLALLGACASQTQNAKRVDAAEEPTAPTADARRAGEDTMSRVPERDTAALPADAARDLGSAAADATPTDANTGAAPDRAPGDMAPARPATLQDFEARTFMGAGAEIRLPYRLFTPKGYDPSKKYALVLFLHGAGERGSDNAKQVANGALSWAQPEVQAKQPAFVVVPQCPSNMQWVDTPWANGSYRIDNVPVSKPMRAVLLLLEALRKEFSVDESRLFAVGLSMGGYGTWDIILRNPTLFAAAMPVCGAGDPTKAALIKTLPLWAFHGDKDTVVPVSGSRDMINALEAAGASPRYTEYPNVTHNSWDRAFGDKAALEWIVSQRR